MKRPITLLVAIALWSAGAIPASAHSLEELDAMLEDRETYYQPLDKEAPDFALENAVGETVRLEDFEGKVVVLHFIYAGCPDVCPLHAERIAEIQSMVNETPMKELVQFITITTDPVNDTVEVMRGFGEAHGLDPINWTFLTTQSDQPEDYTRLLAEGFGHSFTVTEDGYQMHSVVTHVMDGNGRWVANFHGLGFEPTNILLFINGLTNAAVPHGHNDEENFWDRLRGLFK